LAVLPPGVWSSARLPATADWLPEFCQASTVFAVMLMAEFVVLVVTWAPASAQFQWWTALTTGTMLAQWIALSTVAALCLLRPRLLPLSPLTAFTLLAGIVALMAFALAWLAFQIDHRMDIGLTPPLDGEHRFVGGIVAMALLLTVAGLRYGYVHVQWRQRVEAQARAEIAALTARIRPHFLFNSMNTIAGLVREDADLAEQLIEDLADLFRAALAAGEKAHPLGRELELCKRYLAIESLRLGERLTVEWSVEGVPMELPVPPLLLQPLVENAVYHGIQPLLGGGSVRIGARVAGDRLILDVENPRPDPPAVRRGGHGLAQENVRQRLHFAFGARARLEVTERPGYYGASVQIPLPASREKRP
jgi:two-component system sensor histidine kinase AlgZ